MPEKKYLEALKNEIETKVEGIEKYNIKTIFFGGGTPSLFKPKFFQEILDFLAKYFCISKNCEITMELNPGTHEYHNLEEYKKAGINRISMGVQSLNDIHLKKLGRIHKAKEAINAYHNLRLAGFDNINLDLMYGLSNQTLLESMEDLKSIIDLKPEHISWYQLTLEPNTVFFKQKPPIPNTDKIYDMELKGHKMLSENGYNRYEVSAYCKKDKESKHNLNYWDFGDYLGLGAGAHSKLTVNIDKVRIQNKRQPESYITSKDKVAKKIIIRDILFEFMLNKLRLLKNIKINEIVKITSLNHKDIIFRCEAALKTGLIIISDDTICLTNLGKRFLNDTVESFLL